MTAFRTTSALVALASVFALALAACGGGGSSDSAPPAGGETVMVATVDGVGDVLVDSRGDALYSPDQETGGKVLCTAACTSIWIPLTLPAGDDPSGPADVDEELGVVTRPDGATQVTFAGRPLYTFVEDPGPGTVTGNDFADAFGGTSFTWRVAAPAPVSGGSTSTGGGYGY